MGDTTGAGSDSVVSRFKHRGGYGKEGRFLTTRKRGSMKNSLQERLPLTFTEEW